MQRFRCFTCCCCSLLLFYRTEQWQNRKYFGGSSKYFVIWLQSSIGWQWAFTFAMFSVRLAKWNTPVKCYIFVKKILSLTFFLSFLARAFALCTFSFRLYYSSFILILFQYLVIITAFFFFCSRKQLSHSFPPLTFHTPKFSALNLLQFVHTQYHRF